VVVDIDEKSIVVMTRDGQFLEMPRQGTWRLGQEVVVNRRPGRILPVFSRALAAFAAALILVIGLARIEVPHAGFATKAVHSAEQEAARISDVSTAPSTYYVALEPVPGVELTVEQGEIITSVATITSQGLPASMLGSLSGRKLHDGLAQLLRAARDAEKLSSGADEIIFLSVTCAGDGTAREELARQLAGYITKLLPELGTNKTRVVALSGNLGTRTAAHAQNLSIGAYLAYLRAKEKGLIVTPNDIRGKRLEAPLEAASERWFELVSEDGKVAAGELVPAIQTDNVLLESWHE
jgi:hypothetical protein